MTRTPRIPTPAEETAKAKRLDALHEREEKDAAKALAAGQMAPMPKGGWPCLGPGCDARIHAPRRIRGEDGKALYTVCWCSTECHDRWMARFHLPGPHWPRYAEDGRLLGYHLPKGRFVTIEEIDAAGGETGLPGAVP